MAADQRLCSWLPYLLAYLPPADSIESINVVTNLLHRGARAVAGGASIAITLKGWHKPLPRQCVGEYYQDAAINARGFLPQPRRPSPLR